MSVTIHPVLLGFGHCYILRGKKAIMIDAGSPKQAKGFKRALERLSLRAEDIQLIVLTHGHWDHIGSAKEIKDITGAKLALHGHEKDWLEAGLAPLPPGVTAWGRLFTKIMALFMPRVHIPATSVDIVLGDEEFSLTEYGIPGKIMYTPGHSRGSVSVLLETGEAFVGDLAMSGFPLRLGPGLPILAEDLQTVRASLRLLMAAGAETVYPAHGQPFPVDILRKALS